MQRRRCNNLGQMTHIIGVGQHVAARRLGPQIRELHVSDENRWASRSVGGVLQIVSAAIQQQRGAAGVEKNGREGIILAVENELTRRGSEECFGEWPRSKIRIEFNERQAAGVKK